MIDTSKINGNKLIDIILDDACGNINKWWDLVEFVEGYMPPYPRPETRPTKLSIKCGNSYLRHLGHGTYIWDGHYGEDSEFDNHEFSLLCLMRAPVPPHLLKDEVWERKIK